MGDDLKQVLITAGQLQARIGELAAQIDADYAGRDLLLVGVLKGAVMVMADLARAMHLPVEMDWMASNLRSRGPASLAVCAMLRKPGSAQMHVDVRYTGFDIGDEFVVGYGLDYAQRYRNLPFIGTLAPAVYGGS